jgi:hypothetical protein
MRPNGHNGSLEKEHKESSMRTERLRAWIVPASLVVLFMAAGVPAVAGGGASLSRSYGAAALDTIVEVNVENPSSSSVEDLVEVQALVDGQLVAAQETVTLSAGEAASVSVVFPGPVQSVVSTSVIRLGITTDDNNPF